MVASIATRLANDDTRATVAAFPDGSVDRFYDVYADGDRIERREGFVEAISSDRSPAVTVRRSATEPGGHAVNMAVQASLLGNDVTLVGHLDDPVFDELGVETISMGAPADVDVFGFEDGDVLSVEPSDDAVEWSFADLEAATRGRYGAVLSADLLFCTNWASYDALPDVLAELATADLDGGHLLVDPGRATGRDDAAISRLFEVLSDLGDSFDVVLAANGTEVRTLAGAVGHVGSSPADVDACLERLQAAGDLAAAVVHEVDAAIARTPTDRVRTANFEVEPTRHTGGGDRFDAGLGHALARGWSWSDALRLGNACASRYIATGESPGPDELAVFLRDRS